jgi:hypothetical protein
VDPLNLDPWQFWVSAASVLNQWVPAQRSIGLSELLHFGAVAAVYEQLVACIEEVGRAPGHATYPP